jgi:hypothetical protein
MNWTFTLQKAAELLLKKTSWKTHNKWTGKELLVLKMY